PGAGHPPGLRYNRPRTSTNVVLAARRIAQRDGSKRARPEMSADSPHLGVPMTTSDSALSEKLEFAVAIAREAGRLTLEYFQQSGLQVDRKADRSPVTAADRAAEQLLRKKIAERYPHDGIVGE